MDRSTNKCLLLVILSALLISGSQGEIYLGIYEYKSLALDNTNVDGKGFGREWTQCDGGHGSEASRYPQGHQGGPGALSEEEHQRLSSSIGSMAMRDNSNMIASMFRTISQLGFMFDKMKELIMDQRVKDLYENKDNKFDLVMIGYFMNNYQIGIAHKLKVPVVMASAIPLGEIFNDMLGNPNAFSYVPAMGQTVEKGLAMTFVQRVKNYFSILGMKVFMHILENNSAKAYKEVFGDDPNMPDYDDLAKNVSLGFLASHALSEGPIRPLVPAAIEVGGIQIKDTPDPLPKPIEDFLSKATNGAILLSLGSNVKGNHLKPDTVNKMFNVLSKLKQSVIWKWEDLNNTPGKSANILYSKWLPQDDILAHPRVVLFITHAGKGGITEAEYHGKPMLALPLFGDQQSNAERMVHEGFGLSLSLLTLEEQPFQESIVEILNNPQYAQKVKTFSTLYRDRPMTARQSVLYWTEYVLRHHGAPHLQSPLVHMNFVAANNLDLYALLASVLFVFLYTSKFVLSLIIRKLKGNAKNVKKIKKP